MRTIYTNIEKSSRFAKGLKFYFIIMSVIILVVLAALWLALFRYQGHVDADANAKAEEEAITGEVTGVEAYESEKAAQLCFEQYLSSLDTEAWRDLWYAQNPDYLDSQDVVDTFIAEKIINSGFEAFKDPEYSLTKPKYLLIAGDNTIAEFILSGEGTQWAVESVNLMQGGDKTFNVQVPFGCTLYLNGHMVPESYIAEGDTKTASVDNYDEELINPVSYVNYSVSGLLQEIEDGSSSVEVRREGTDSVAVLSADGNYYETLRTDATGDYKLKAEGFIGALLRYYSMGKENAEDNMYSVLSHVAGGSVAANVIKESLSGVVWRVADYSVKYGTQTSDVYIISDNCFCVDVTYTAENQSTTYETGDGIYRVYFIDRGDGYSIVSFAGIQ